MKRIMIMSLALIAGLVTAISIGNVVFQKQQVIQTSAQWKEIYRTPGGLVAGADLIVVAEHLLAEPGRVVGTGEDATPFTNNTFGVQSILKGSHNGENLVLEQTGGMLASGAIVNINDGGAYVPGTQYLLFLKDRGDGVYYLINHQARYRINGNILEGVDPTDSVVAKLHGQTLEESGRMIANRIRMLE